MGHLLSPTIAFSPLGAILTVVCWLAEATSLFLKPALARHLSLTNLCEISPPAAFKRLVVLQKRRSSFILFCRLFLPAPNILTIYITSGKFPFLSFRILNKIDMSNTKVTLIFCSAVLWWSAFQKTVGCPTGQMSLLQVFGCNIWWVLKWVWEMSSLHNDMRDTVPQVLLACWHFQD